MANILITGASGFLAGYLIPLLKKQNNSIVGLVRGDAKTGQVIDVDQIYHSIESLTKAYPFFDQIYHLSSYVPYGRMNIADQRLIEDNISMTAQLAVNYPDAKFVFSSSVAVYGAPLSLPISVTSPFNQPDHYGLSKLAAEAIVMNLANYCIIRFSSIIGAGMKTNTFVPIIANTAIQNKIIKLKGSGSRFQNYIDVRDAARLCVHGAESGFQGVMLGVSENSVTNVRVAEIIQQLTEAAIFFQGEDTSESYIYEVADRYRKMDFNLLYSIEQTLKDLVLSMQ